MRWQQVEADLRAQVAALQAAVEEKDKDMHTVMATVDRLQAMPNGFRSAGTVSDDDDEVMLNVLGCQLTLGTS